MTAVQLNAEILHNMSLVAEDEGLMKQLAKYLRKLVVKKQDATLMTKEEFGARIAQAEREIAEGKGKTFANIEQMNDWLNSL